MSGTSLDGIDVALLDTDGETVLHHGPSFTVNYDDAQRALLRQGLVDAKGMTTRGERSKSLARLEQLITQWHQDAVHRFCELFGITRSKIDVIGFHGQTVLHRPEQALTVQLGHGQQLATGLGIPVVYDLRAADVAQGGQGAPMVPVYHRALVQQVTEKPVAIVNIGGVANVTWVGASGALVAFDTGPGNALIDDWMKHHTGQSRDDGGAIALCGTAQQHVVDGFLRDPYFDLPAPKSLDRNHFAKHELGGLSLEDGAATLVAVTAQSIAASVWQMPSPPQSWIICGGGRHNAAIMAALRALLPNVVPAEQQNLSGDAIEAEAWAFLAVRSLRGLPISFPGTTGVKQPISGGLLAKPV